MPYIPDIIGKNSLFPKALKDTKITSEAGLSVVPGKKQINIIHLMMLVKNDLLLFKRPCGTWSFLSGEIESSETSILAAVRETKEEIGLNITAETIFAADYLFSGTSPKGRPFLGQSVWTRIDDFHPWRLNLKKDEIVGWQLVPMDKAFDLLDKGFKESIAELIHYKEHGIINS